MKPIRGLFIGLFTGLLLASGWAVFIDAQINSLDAFEAVHLIPCLGSTVAAIAVNMVSISRISESMEVKLWLFFWFTVSCACIGSSIWIIAREYAPPVAPYPGVSILLQTVLSLLGGFLFFVGRKSTTQYDYDD